MKHDDMAVQSALDTLMRAEEIKSDEKLMALVLKKIKAKKKSIESLEELRELAYSGDDGEDDEEEEGEE